MNGVGVRGTHFFVVVFLLYANLGAMDASGWRNSLNKATDLLSGRGEPKTLSQWAKRVFDAPEAPTPEQRPARSLIAGSCLHARLIEFIGSEQQLGLWAEGMDRNDLGAPGLHGQNKFSNLHNNAHNAFYDNKRQSDLYSHVRRVTLGAGQSVAMVADLHGSLHSLLRVLLHMQTRGLIDDHFVLAPGIHFVSLGDVVDRGWYGAECFYTLLRLKAANPNRVFLVRGNHEDDAICWGNGDKFGIDKPAFWYELQHKFPATAEQLQRLFVSLYRLCPIALFMGRNGTFMQCCHGGIDPSFSPAWLLEQAADTIQIIDYKVFDGVNNHGLVWGDFVQKPLPGKGSLYLTARSWTCAAPLLEAYLSPAADLHQQACAQIQQVPAQHLPSVPYPHGKVAFVMRGHQDIRCPCKVLIGSKRTDVIQKFSGFDPYDGPVDWHLVLPHLFGDLYEYAVPCSVFCPEGLAPVITLTNATDTQGLDYGGYAVVTCAEKREDWTLQVKYLPCLR